MLPHLRVARLITFIAPHDIIAFHTTPFTLTRVDITTGDAFVWPPNAFAFPMDYVDAVEAARIRDLTAQLRRFYFGQS